jgi:hypothetical protein
MCPHPDSVSTNSASTVLAFRPSAGIILPVRSTVFPLYVISYHEYLIDEAESSVHFIMKSAAFKGMYCLNPICPFYPLQSV